MDERSSSSLAASADTIHFSVASSRLLTNLLPENPKEILGRGHQTLIALAERRKCSQPCSSSSSSSSAAVLGAISRKFHSLSLPFRPAAEKAAPTFALYSERHQCRIDLLSSDLVQGDGSERRRGGRWRRAGVAIIPLWEEREAGRQSSIVASEICVANQSHAATRGPEVWRGTGRKLLPLAMISTSAEASLSAEKQTTSSSNVDSGKENGSGAMAAQEKFKEVVAKAQMLAEKLAKKLGGKEKPLAQVMLSSWEPSQGDTLAILVTLPTPQSFLDVLILNLRQKMHKGPLVDIRYANEPISAHLYVKAPPVWRALIPTTPLHNPGPQMLTVEVHDGRHRPFTGTVNLQKREFPVESIWLSDTKSGITCTAKELEAVAAFRGSRTPEQLWHGPFGQPSDGVVTTGYGLQRFYNGIFAEGYYHRGIDYGAETGDAVKSPAGGRVVMVGRESEGFAVHGNCVGLDHGHGVLSLMMHLDSINVTEGALVRAGEMVGTVGETGIATGPHLHWGLYVNGECVDPDQWMQPQSWS